jgi:hypothetical protein
MDPVVFVRIMDALALSEPHTSYRTPLSLEWAFLNMFEVMRKTYAVINGTQNTPIAKPAIAKPAIAKPTTTKPKKTGATVAGAGAGAIATATATATTATPRSKRNQGKSSTCA